MRSQTLIFINAKVITLDPANPKAQAIAIRNGKILDVCSNEQILRYVTDETEVIDVKGKTVVPGFIDSHVHMLGFGQSLRNLDLRNVDSIEEMQNKLKKYARDRPECGWILGGGGIRRGFPRSVIRTVGT